jgi:hypothetical protein
LPVKDLQRIEDFREEHTNGEFQDRPYFGHLFYLSGKPEGSRSGVAKGLQ